MPTTTTPDPLDSSNLPPCDPDVFARGVPILVSNTIRAVDFEPWVRKVAGLSGQRVDWHYAGGRAIVLCLGDVAAASAACVALRAEHDALFLAALSPHTTREEAERYLEGIWNYPVEGMAATGAEERARYTISVQ